MKKTIILEENAFNKIKNLMIRESVKEPPKPEFIQKYLGDIESLAKITNLHEDRYKDYDLETAYNDWKNTGYDKNSEEYLIYISNFKRFMFGNGGFLTHISYALTRLKNKNGESLPLHSIILDKDWVNAAFKKSNWKFSDTNSNSGSGDKQCFYTTVLKLYQNPTIWNDFFFNPIFQEYYDKFLYLRKQITWYLIKDIEYYKRNYAKILPIKEYVALNNFAGKIKEVNEKLEFIPNTENAHPELFYDPKFGTNEYSYDENYTEEEY